MKKHDYIIATAYFSIEETYIISANKIPFVYGRVRSRPGLRLLIAFCLADCGGDKQNNPHHQEASSHINTHHACPVPTAVI
jgi:hypothetical protein